MQEYRYLPTYAQERPTRMLSASVPIFADYGYQTVNGAIRAIRQSLIHHQEPHVISIIGKPKAGKKHVEWDIAARLGRTLQRIGEERGSPVYMGEVLWGDCFSIAKLRGSIPLDGEYGQFTNKHLDAVSGEFEDLTHRVIQERQGATAVIFLKAPAVTMACINTRLLGLNRAYTPLRGIARREAPFDDLRYRDYWIAKVNDPEAEQKGNIVRTKAEGLTDNPLKLIEELKREGEIILTQHPETTSKDLQGVVRYILESANPAASEEIKFYVDALAGIMSMRGRFRLNGQRYYLTSETEGLTTALVLRDILEHEENFGLRRRVFLGETDKLDKIILDLRFPIQNVALAYYPEIKDIRNK